MTLDNYCSSTIKIIIFIFFLTILISCNKSEFFCNKNKSNKIIFCLDFEESKVGRYSQRALISDWGNIIKLSNSGIMHHGINQDRVSIVTNNGNNMLEVKYPKGKFGSEDSGATWIMRLPKKFNHLLFEYKVKFGENFLFSKKKIGGKLPGISGGRNNSGGVIPTGNDGWSSRIMWGKEGRGLEYLYYPDMKTPQYNLDAFPYGVPTDWFANKYFTYSQGKKCISEWPRPKGKEFRFESDKVYTIRQEIKMNTLKENGDTNFDGIAKVWIDNKLLVNCSKIRYRFVGNISIEYLFFSTFLGGSTFLSSAHPMNEKIYFDDFLVTKK